MIMSVALYRQRLCGTSGRVLLTCQCPAPSLETSSIRLRILCMQGHQQGCSWLSLLLLLLPAGVEA